MKHLALFGSVAACIGFGLAAPAFATAVNPPSSSDRTSASVKPSETCWTDLRTFTKEMQKDGYWLSGVGYGYGYPMMGGNAAAVDANQRSAASGYQSARPGYDVRTLIAAATILARDGKQQACEDTLATTRDVYKVYISEMKSGKTPMADLPDWQTQQLVAAQPIAATNVALRSDQLIGVDVLNKQNVALGSVEDLVMSPQTGKIAYLVIAHGGIFGIDKKYVPVPWGDFKITPSGSLLVLDAKESVMQAGPMVSHDQFATPGRFDQESQTVDNYWKAHISTDAIAITQD
ncbi:PRC-barrel domain-containing protein [Rhizobium sp. BR 315]|uniref:PRC-barrel domain-containing protein n=1 Tax=Rhizobium sp. BR 315 TaxID=3040014 RepID=UPI003D33AEAE